MRTVALLAQRQNTTLRVRSVLDARPAGRRRRRRRLADVRREQYWISLPSLTDCHDAVF